MSIYREPELIKSFIESYPTNIKQSLAQLGEKKEKVSNILDVKYRYSNEKFECSLDLGDLFENAYFQSIGFDTSPQFIEELDRYQLLLKDSFAVCNNLLTPLFIKAFKCHWIAAVSGATGEGQESFITAMRETGEIAKILASEYEGLEKAFELSRARIAKLGTRLHENQYSVFSASDYREDPLAQRMITSLDSSIHSSFRMNSRLIDTSSLFGRANFHIWLFSMSSPLDILTEPTFLDDAFAAEYKESEALEHFYQALEEGQKVIRSIMPPMQPEEIQALKEFKQLLEGEENIPTSNLQALESSLQDKCHSTDGVRLMKTGRKLLIEPEICETPLTQMIKSMSIDFESAFEESFLEWVAAAKINQETVSSLRRVIFTIKMTKQRILTTEKDPLVIALNGTSS